MVSMKCLYAATTRTFAVHVEKLKKYCSCIVTVRDMSMDR
jgi:hypothetical protein